MAIGHRNKHHPDDDVEATAPDHGSSSLDAPLDEKNLSEYEALDRFITSYDASGQRRGAHEESDREAEHIPWWKFWKSSDDGVDLNPRDREGKPPPEWLETDIHSGISSSEVAERRRRFGWNELTAEKENQFAKFLSFFQGPILYGEPLKTYLP